MFAQNCLLLVITPFLIPISRPTTSSSTSLPDPTSTKYHGTNPFTQLNHLNIAAESGEAGLSLRSYPRIFGFAFVRAERRLDFPELSIPTIPISAIDFSWSQMQKFSPLLP